MIMWRKNKVKLIGGIGTLLLACQLHALQLEPIAPAKSGVNQEVLARLSDYLEQHGSESMMIVLTGAGVQMLGVYPSRNMVFVHRVNTEQPYQFKHYQIYPIIKMVFASLPSRDSSEP